MKIQIVYMYWILNTLNPIGVIGVDNMPHGFDIDYVNNKLYVACINSIVCIDIINKSVCIKN